MKSTAVTLILSQLYRVPGTTIATKSKCLLGSIDYFWVDGVSRKCASELLVSLMLGREGKALQCFLKLIMF